MGGGQPRIAAASARIAGTPNTGSSTPTAAKLSPCQRSRQKASARCEITAAGACGSSGIMFGNARSAALYDASGKGAS